MKRGVMWPGGDLDQKGQTATGFDQTSHGWSRWTLTQPDYLAHADLVMIPTFLPESVP